MTVTRSIMACMGRFLSAFEWATHWRVHCLCGIPADGTSWDSRRRPDTFPSESVTGYIKCGSTRQRVHQETTMPHWEYKLIAHTDVESEGMIKGRSRESLEQYLNDLGGEGWEVINVDFVDHMEWK